MRWLRVVSVWTLVVSAGLCGCQKSPEPMTSPPPGGASTGSPAYSNLPAGAPGSASAPASGAAATIGQSAANAALKAKVKNALITTKGLDTSHMDVEAAADGAVTLTGEVHSDAEKALAEKKAKGVAGVAKVTNKLKVTAGH